MRWIKDQFVIIMTLASLLGGLAMTWGRMGVMVDQIKLKADRETMALADTSTKEAVAAGQFAILRELNNLQGQVQAITTRLDGVVQRQAIITPGK